MFGLKKWLKRGSPPSISTDVLDMQRDSPETEICVSATDSAFGVDDTVVGIDFVDKLPYEVSVAIMGFIGDVRTFAVLPCVSKRWNRVSQDNEVWKPLYLQRWKPIASMRGELGQTILKKDDSLVVEDLADGSNDNLAAGSRIPRPSLTKLADEMSRISVTGSPKSPHKKDKKPSTLTSTDNRNWKALYHQRLALQLNWVNGRYTPLSYIGHSDAVYCIQFDPRHIVSGSRDRTIKFWDMTKIKSGESKKSLQRTLRGHAGSVLCLQYDHRYVVTGSSDSTIAVWDFKTGERLFVLTGHSAPVLDVRFNEDLIVSCSKDWTIKVWDLTTGTLVRTLQGHHAAVNAVHLHGDLVASASGDCVVKLWNIRTGQHVRDFLGHSRGLACVQFDGKTIVSGSNDKTIKIWNVETGECLRTLEGHKDLVRTLCFDKDRIVSGSYDMTIKVWDFNTGQLLHDLAGGHNSWVFHVQMDATKVVSASQDRKIVVWDFGVDVPLAQEFV
ncbi:hypothetical protein HDV05_000834 [Chytridiales sp. JEL 0842]|nr:hypothetical protein HDV05_000834 [Chytridiales sp. JEL 0842]